VVATNAVGNSAASAPSNSVTPKAPATVPGAPTGVTATAGNASAAVSWTAPASDGGSAITSYTVSSSPAGASATVTGTSATLTGLANGTTYTFTVVATNAIGNSAPSLPSNGVTPVAPVVLTAPGAPTAVSATAGNAQATIRWTAPASDGGSAITSYTVSVATANGAAPTAPISATVAAPATSATITGLRNGTVYTFTVTATNAIGTGLASAPSNGVKPIAPPAPLGQNDDEDAHEHPHRVVVRPVPPVIVNQTN
jgi:Fibronectin type III domain